MRSPSRARWLRARLTATITHRYGEVIAVAALLLSFVGLNVVVSPFYGFDPPNYLVTMWTVWKGSYTGTELRRPFLIAVPLRLLGTVLPYVVANRVLGITLALGVSVPTYLLYRRTIPRNLAALGAVAITLVGPYAGMLIWGYITFFGIVLYYLALFKTVTVAESDGWTRRDFLSLAVLYALVFYVHQITALYLVTSVAVFTVFRFLRGPRALRDYLVYPAAGVVGTVLAVPVLPVYLRLASVSSAGNESSAVAGLTTVVGQILNFLSKLVATPSLFLLLLLVSVVGLLALSRTELELFASILAISIPSFTFLLGSAPARMLYFLPPMAGLCALKGGTVILQVVADRLDRETADRWPPIPGGRRVAGLVDADPRTFDAHALVRLLAVVVVTVVIVSNLGAYLVIAGNAQSFYLTLDEEQEETLPWIDENLPEDAVVATSQKSFGWNVEGYTKRNAFEPHGQKSYMKEFFFPEQRRQAYVQDRVFSRHLSVENGNVRAAFSGQYDAPGSPTVGLNTGNYRTYAAFLDNETTVVLDTGEGQLTRQLSAAQTRLTVGGTMDRRVVTTTYTWDELRLNKTTTVERGTAAVSVRYRIVSTAHSVERLRTAVRYPIAFQPTDHRIDGDSATVEQTNRFGMPVTGSLVTSADGRQAELDYRVTPPRNRTVVTFTEPVNASVSLGYTMNRPLRTDAVAPYETPSVLADDDIGYVAWIDPPNQLEPDYDRETLTWFYASPYYRPVYEGSEVVVFRVDRSAFPDPIRNATVS